MDPENQQNNPQKVYTPDQQGSQEPQATSSDSASYDEQYKSRSLSSQPYSAAQPQPTPNNVSNVNNTPGKKLKLPKGPVLAGIIGAVLVIVLLIFALAAGGGNKPQDKKGSTSISNTQPEALKPANSIELEQTNNAISQDLSRLDDERDLPNNSLEDSTLGL